MSKPTCFFCQKPKPHTELREVLIGGDEEPSEEVPACGPCITKRRERREAVERLREVIE